MEKMEWNRKIHWNSAWGQRKVDIQLPTNNNNIFLEKEDICVKSRQSELNGHTIRITSTVQRVCLSIFNIIELDAKHSHRHSLCRSRQENWYIFESKIFSENLMAETVCRNAHHKYISTGFIFHMDVENERKIHVTSECEFFSSRLSPSLANINFIRNLKYANQSAQTHAYVQIEERMPKQNNVNLVLLLFDDCALYLGIACIYSIESLRSDTHTHKHVNYGIRWTFPSSIIFFL